MHLFYGDFQLQPEPVPVFRQAVRLGGASPSLLSVALLRMAKNGQKKVTSCQFMAAHARWNRGVAWISSLFFSDMKTIEELALRLRW